ncbi:MAG: serine hydrolase [Planctomycetales bacterium]|nr:serine hydrolase [Planctomycetales bacterium]
MKHVLAIIQSVFLVFLVASACVTSPCRADDAAKAMASKLEELCRKHDIPAMCAAVVNSDGVVQSQCFGVRKRGAVDKVELSDRFSIGSNTKSMTATLAAVLVEAGKIDWTTTIGDVWPAASSKDIHPQLRNVTLDQLLSHQSGLTANISDVSAQAWASFFAESQSPTLERRRMLKLVLSHAPAGPPGKFLYSNLGYAVVAAMLETRAGEPYESLMKKHVFDPLGMGSADFRSLKSAQQLQPPLLWGHKSDGAPIDPRSVGADNPTVYASVGTVHLSVEDYAKYARWHLAAKPAPVLRTQGACDHLREPLADRSAREKYGCGWICLNTEFGPALTHGGSNTNALALIWIFPQANLAAVACSNSGQPEAFEACDEMIGFMLQQRAGSAAKSDSKPAGDTEKVDPKRLVGRYQLAPNFIFDVKYQDSHLLVGITNQPTQEVFPDSPTKWSYRGVKAQLEFHLRASGPAYALTLHQNGAAQKAARIRE